MSTINGFALQFHIAQQFMRLPNNSRCGVKTASLQR
jgi:hypothetical protein